MRQPVGRENAYLHHSRCGALHVRRLVLVVRGDEVIFHEHFRGDDFQSGGIGGLHFRLGVGFPLILLSRGALVVYQLARSMCFVSRTEGAVVEARVRGE